MRTIIFPVAAAMIIFSAVQASAPAQADDIHGAPIRNGDPCFNHARSYERDARFGYWSACPQTASVPVATTTQSRRIRENAVTELGRLKMKIGEAEFEADVPQNKIQPMYARFLSMLKRRGGTPVGILAADARSRKQMPDIQPIVRGAISAESGR